jgi:hypothetical protein
VQWAWCYLCRWSCCGNLPFYCILETGSMYSQWYCFLPRKDFLSKTTQKCPQCQMRVLLHFAKWMCLWNVSFIHCNFVPFPKLLHEHYHKLDHYHQFITALQRAQWSVETLNYQTFLILIHHWLPISHDYAQRFLLSSSRYRKLMFTSETLCTN